VAKMALVSVIGMLGMFGMLACAGILDDEAAVEKPEVTVAERLASGPRSDLVDVSDGRYEINYFAVCGPALAEASESSRVELLVHSEALQGDISRDRFVALSTLTMVNEVDELVANRAGAESGASRTECVELPAPEGDVDYELSMDVLPDSVAVEIKEVAKSTVANTVTKPVAGRQAAQHCANDSVGRLHCAQAPEGTAVRTNLGGVVCARGACAREAIGDWRCSRTSGGWAELDYSGRPSCERGCYAPTSTQCRVMR
jgi:hypothetical protein